jgi:hypothetical protein
MLVPHYWAATGAPRRTRTSNLVLRTDLLLSIELAERLFEESVQGPTPSHDAATSGSVNTRPLASLAGPIELRHTDFTISSSWCAR